MNVLETISYSLIIIILLAVLARLYCKMTTGFCSIKRDMTGKTVLITGANSGIGKATAMELARRKARVILACRNIEKANKVANEIKITTGNQNVTVQTLDLSSFESVRHCAKSILDTEDRLDVLINNAGILNAPRQLTADGCELIMQSNHFGHFLLTILLLELLKKSAPSRIICVSSTMHWFALLDLCDITNKRNLNHWIVYNNSKLANILFTRELAERLCQTGVTVNSLHPGVVRSELVEKLEFGALLSLILHYILNVIGKSCDDGAQTTIQLSVDPKFEKVTGKHFSDCRQTLISFTARNKNLATRLFELSEKITGVTF